MFLSSKYCYGLLAALFIVCSPALAAPRGDTNEDGKLDPAEFHANLKARLMKADTNGDGKISLDEWKARSAARNGKGDPTKIFTRLDKNGDGFLDDSEIASLAERRFHRLDADGDGFLTKQELQARRAAAKH